ncbi:MAG: hypothetical protein JWO03_1234, partial [Bacteroidetes bacterium]|nr:hypothetical protein [Bacteroidota bacterium]
MSDCGSQVFPVDCQPLFISDVTSRVLQRYSSISFHPNNPNTMANAKLPPRQKMI